MNYIVVPSDEADEDVCELATFLTKRNPEIGWRFQCAVDETYRRIADNPEWKALAGFRLPPMANARICPMKGFSNYLIFYRIESDRIEILRVLHGATDYMNLFDAESSV